MLLYNNNYQSFQTFNTLTEEKTGDCIENQIYTVIQIENTNDIQINDFNYPPIY
jgi:hypothetical protein